MTVRPIPFSDPMIVALREGRKTQTRRMLDLACDEPPAYVQDGVVTALNEHDQEHRWPNTYAVGDHLYVRETYYQFGHWEPVQGAKTKGGKQKWAFIADRPDVLFEQPGNCRLGHRYCDPWTPAWHKRLGRFMPKAFSRMTLIVTDVRVQMLNKISEEDAIAEGVLNSGRRDGEPWDHFSFPGIPSIHEHEASTCYSLLWESITGPGAWEANPWVTAITFTVHHCNVDQIGEAA